MQYTTYSRYDWILRGCFIRISKIHLYAIHNTSVPFAYITPVVLSGFQRYICMQYTTLNIFINGINVLFYQDFKDTFVCNTQPFWWRNGMIGGCFIRISKIHLYAIHNTCKVNGSRNYVVLSGFQRYICMQYTTRWRYTKFVEMLFYQDFKDTFVCNTQHTWQVNDR